MKPVETHEAKTSKSIFFPIAMPSILARVALVSLLTWHKKVNLNDSRGGGCRGFLPQLD
jgi:hypothetical protein